MKNKIITNATIEIVYFLVYLSLLWNISGGNIFLIFLFVCSVLLHVVVLVIIYYRNKKNRENSLFGVLIGIVVVAGVFCSVNYIKGLKKPSVEISK